MGTGDKAMKWGKFALGCVAVVAVSAIALDMYATVVARDGFYRLYTERLDKWVEAGGPQSEIQSGVIPNCSKLAITQAGPIGAISLLFDGTDYDFRSDVCFQVTVNRVYPQPRFADAKMVSLVCESKDELFRKLCAHANLRKH